MPGRQPVAADFPASVEVTIIAPPNDAAPSSALVLLHGLGDTPAPFARFASALALPSTACLAVRGPHPLPDLLGLPGFHWGDDIVLDQRSGDVDPDAGFAAAVRLVRDDVVAAGLVGKCGFAPRDVVLFGFGQGGMVALQVAAEAGAEKELGGVVSIGGPLPAGTKVGKGKSRTPVLMCRGAKESAVSEDAAEKVKGTFEFAELKTWRRAGDAMPSNKEEMLPIMQFFARRLARMSAPEGSVEIM